MLSLRRPALVAFLVLYHYFFLFSNALPLRARQASPPRSVTTVSSVNTPQGPATMTCVVVFTPIQDAQGNDAIEEVRTCTLRMDNAAPDPGPPPTAPATATPSPTNPAATVTNTATVTEGDDDAPATTTTSSAAPTSTSASDSDDAPTSTSSSGAPDNAPTSTSSSDAPDATDTSAGDGAIAVIGLTTVSGPLPTATPTPTTSTATDAPATTTSSTSSDAPDPTDAPDSTPAPVADGDSTTDASDTATPSAAAAASGSAAAVESPTEAAFTMPGKQLSVLPIGLGVFAGISVIALIVVGLVTYERTKYRKAFRQRKLAESGAAMGYGGNMA